MTNIELDVAYALKNIPDLVRDLKRMNQLKALELKGKAGFDMNITVNQVDAIMEDNNNS